MTCSSYFPLSIWYALILQPARSFKHKHPRYFKACLSNILLLFNYGVLMFSHNHFSFMITIFIFIRSFIIFLFFIILFFSLFISRCILSRTFYLLDLTINSISISSLSFWADNCLNIPDTPIIKFLYNPLD